MKVGWRLRWNLKDAEVAGLMPGESSVGGRGWGGERALISDRGFN